MLKKKVTGASVRVEFDLYLGGSVVAGTVSSGATAVRTELTIDSPESPEDIARLIRLHNDRDFDVLARHTPLRVERYRTLRAILSFAKTSSDCPTRSGASEIGGQDAEPGWR